MSDLATGGDRRLNPPEPDPLEQERTDPGHFARQGDYDDPGACLIHDGGLPPGALHREEEAMPSARREPPTDPEYLAWKEAELNALDADYQQWRRQQAEAYDDAYRNWRDAPGHTPFAQWREAVNADRPSRRPWSRRR
ncbi:hypothetical protein GCM10007301_02530 [Azorhizobium oxalatiphilum]|uniref:Uncharacterized protein n=1 Tax=Azorhizobium oxalatiphilum TaxID=980631 RepID=A0A917F4R7_9HYPH|nr:hypothetical protein [Azorhizobium oxalatiphilum]GGF46514.1 hypothetical protein GCM10007301_02530 [Azorhizobium oxalatiphilum]